MHALVLDGHSRAAVEVVQSLGRTGLRVDVSSNRPDCLAFASRFASRRLQQPSPARTQEFLSWLRDRDARDRYGLLVPTTEASLLAFRYLPEDDPLRTRAFIASDRALDVALDKERTWQLARDLGIPVAESVLISTAEGVPPAARYPVVLRPVRSKGASGGEIREFGVSIARTPAERDRVLTELLGRTAVQQMSYVRGRGAGVEFLYVRGRAAWHFAHERIHEWPLTGGGSTYRRSIVPSPEMLGAGRRLLDGLGWHGLAMVEFKLEEDGTFFLVEVNPRLWGSVALAIDAGVDFPRGLATLARGTPLPPQPRYPADLFTRNIGRDIDWRSVTSADVAEADLVLLMDLGNYERFALRFENAVGRATLLGLFGSEPRPEIEDPYELSEAGARRVLEQIESCVGGLASWLRSGAEGSISPSSARPASGAEHGPSGGPS